MSYCLGSLEYQAKEWERRTVVPQFSGEHAEGATAYAHKQAAICQIVADNFRVLWARYLIGSNLESMVNIGSSLSTSTYVYMHGDESDDELGGSDLKSNNDGEQDVNDDEDGDDTL
ncbi:hypothetical protein BT96DRAFT_812327 [Gymnopus androsaceus JB14]|uniref:Uncharacterized protein n=1 Tax=Gymnopus androsaceus JB14 TaxID=1447944 RepID=A0A6A4I9I9_9AGAR|nr:hypothetical protein BT96DRAFT_812327 [Gymnopus androsaceus JB14]